MTIEEYIEKNKTGKGYKENALGWFIENLGKKVSSQELAIITGKNGNPISHNIRRIFELRDEDGYDIINHKDDRGKELQLKVDEWILMSDKPNPKKIRSRGVNKKIMMEVFSRDNFQCQTCGRTPADDDPFREGHKIKLHTGHIDPHKNDSRNDSDNDKKLTKDDFITMCNVCNEGLSNKELKIITLLDKVKKAPEKEQKEVYLYLKSIYG